MPDRTEPSAERKTFYTHIGIQVPESLRPETVLITMMTPRASDVVEFIDPVNRDNPNPRGELISGKQIGAKLRVQQEGDVIAINYLGVSKSENVTSSQLTAYSFTKEDGWIPLNGTFAFPVKQGK